MAVRRLYLLRHARAAAMGLGTTDYERPLSGRGRRSASAVGAYLRTVDAPPQWILCSSARRAVETAMYLVAQISSETDIEVSYDRDLYLAAPEVLLDHIRQVDPQYTNLLVVAHNPGIQDLALALTQESQHTSQTYRTIIGKFQTGAIASFSFDGDTWECVSPRSGNLLEYVRP